MTTTVPGVRSGPSTDAAQMGLARTTLAVATIAFFVVTLDAVIVNGGVAMVADGPAATTLRLTPQMNPGRTHSCRTPTTTTSPREPS